jgi:hypothetical protein
VALPAAAGMAVALTLAWQGLVPLVTALWGAILAFWMGALGLDAPIQVAQVGFGGLLQWEVPYPALTARLPSAGTWWGTMGVTLLALGASWRLPRHLVPVIYLLRVLVCIQLTSLLFFAVVKGPGIFPHPLPRYLADMLTMSLMMVSLLPLLLGLTLFIFDLPLSRKLGLAALMLLHQSLLAPFQYALQAYLIHKLSLLWMPLLYLTLGLPLNVLTLLGLYGWGMSWRGGADASEDASRQSPDAGAL